MKYSRTLVAVIATMTLSACSDAPSLSQMEKAIVEGANVFGATMQTVNVSVGLVRTEQYNKQASSNELLKYLMDEGYISQKVVIADGSPAAKPAQAGSYGARGNGEWLHAGNYSEIKLEDKLNDYLSDEEPRTGHSTRVMAKVAQEPGAWQQTIPHMPLRDVSMERLVVTLPIYETKFEKIIRTKDVSEISASCDLSVEYSVTRDLTEFGMAAPSLVRSFKKAEDLSVCFTKYDDEWRIQN